MNNIEDKLVKIEKTSYTFIEKKQVKNKTIIVQKTSYVFIENKEVKKKILNKQVKEVLYFVTKIMVEFALVNFLINLL